MHSSYEAIFDDTIRQVFNEYVKALELPFIDYFAIGVQDRVRMKSASLMSRVDWQKYFKEREFAEHDPIRLASLNTQSKIFTFEEVDCRNNFGKEVMRHRRKHGIQNGLVIMDRTLGHNFMLTLATGYNKFDGYKFYYEQRQAIDSMFADFKSIIEPIAKGYKHNL